MGASKGRAARVSGGGAVNARRFDARRPSLSRMAANSRRVEEFTDYVAAMIAEAEHYGDRVSYDRPAQRVRDLPHFADCILLYKTCLVAGPRLPVEWRISFGILLDGVLEQAGPKPSATARLGLKPGVALPHALSWESEDLARAAADT